MIMIKLNSASSVTNPYWAAVVTDHISVSWKDFLTLSGEYFETILKLADNSR